MRQPSIPESWLRLRDELARGPSAVLVIGGSDSGKSTVCRWLAAQWAQAGANCALIDADVGQSQLGPPACIGYARLPEGGEREAEAFFVGDVSPRRVPAGVLGALAEAVRAARAAGAQRLVIDSTGWVSGAEAVALKVAKAAILGEVHTVLVEREDELRAFRRAWRGLERFPLHALQAAPEVRRRSPEERRAHREATFREHLAAAVVCEIDLRKVAVWGAGRLQSPRPAVPAGLLLGLNDIGGRLLSLGVLEELQAGRGVLRCLCRPEGAGAAEVRLGRLFIEPDGMHRAAYDEGETT
jgi:polynucleotide 5'-hydroxyl-kinase GRC3/NOL9